MVDKCVGVIRCVWGHFLVDSQSKAVQGGLDSSADLSVFLDVVHSGCLLDREWVEGTSFGVWHKEMLRCMCCQMGKIAGVWWVWHRKMCAEERCGMDV